MTSAICSLVLASSAFAAGTDQLNEAQRLDPGTLIRVDILDHQTETFVWRGATLDTDGVTLLANQAEILDPDRNAYGVVEAGEVIVPNVDGAWRVKPIGLDPDGNGNLNPINEFDVTVFDPGGAALPGRVWSTEWTLNTGNITQDLEWNGSYYTIVEGGDPYHTPVVELLADGLSGNIYVVRANEIGIRGGDGRSQPQGFGGVPSTYSIYLEPPENATYTYVPPELGEVDVAFDDECNGIAVGQAQLQLAFFSNIEGNYHLVCDLDGDGFEIAVDDDFHQLEEAHPGFNLVTWDGSDNTGAPVPPGRYACQLILTVGEFHYVASDIETFYEGFRTFYVDADHAKSGLPIHWNDAEVQSRDDPMPNGDLSAEHSPIGGLMPGAYTDPARPHGEVIPGNARAWGEFRRDRGKGESSDLDTYTWIDEDTFLLEDIEVFDPDADSDGDGVPDACDDCEGFDDADDADQDEVPDGCDRCPGYDDALDEDGDGAPDACDACPGYDDREDLDGDGAPDACDPCPLDRYDDSDLDGSCDTDDLCPGYDDRVDPDLDGVPDGCDVCPGYDDRIDPDLDGVPDGCDPCPIDNPDDTDLDGVCDSDDVCPGYDDAIDPDLDGVPEGCDRCAGYDDRLDADLDLVPDACDACPGYDDRLDADLDLAPDDCDVCPGFDDRLDADLDTVPDQCDVCADQDDRVDTDSDLVPDGCDVCAGSDDALDADADGVPDGCDVCAGSDDTRDEDFDGTPDGCDRCADFDDAADADLDTVPDGCDACEGSDDALDTDNDLVPDGCDVCPEGNDADDEDGDEVPDACDACPGAHDGLDADADGLPDGCEEATPTDDFDDGTEPGEKGCGCASAPAPLSAAWWLGLGVVLIRVARRR